MKKRGQYIVVYLLIGLVISAMIVVALTTLVRSLGTDSTLEREYLSKDLALLLDTIYGSPGDLEYFYSIPERFHISISNNLVTVKDNVRRAESSYYFAGSPEYNELKFNSEGSPRALKIIKTGDLIAIKGVYDQNERAAISQFNELTEFMKGNTARRYNFKCKEVYPIKLESGYFIVVSIKGDASLYFEQDKLSEEISKAKFPELTFLETNTKETFMISSKNFWSLDTYWITNRMIDKVIIVNDDAAKKWNWAQPTIEINELPECEAQELAKKAK